MLQIYQLPCFWGYKYTNYQGSDITIRPMFCCYKYTNYHGSEVTIRPITKVLLLQLYQVPMF